MIPRPYRLFGATEQQVAIRQATAQISAWVGEWMASRELDPKLEIVPAPTVATEGACWELAGKENTSWVAVGYGDAWARQMSGLLLGDGGGDEAGERPAPHTVVAVLTRRVMQDLAARLFASTGIAGIGQAHGWPGAPPADVGQPGAAYLAARCALSAGITLDILFWPEMIDAWMGQPEGRAGGVIVPVRSAIDNELVSLEIVVGDGELTIEELSTLAVGDVIPLGRKLTQEVEIKLDADTPVCRGFLGGANGSMAVQVTSSR